MKEAVHQCKFEKLQKVYHISFFPFPTNEPKENNNNNHRRQDFKFFFWGLIDDKTCFECRRQKVNKTTSNSRDTKSWRQIEAMTTNQCG